MTPLLVSHVLGQVLLRPALATVFSTLLQAGGPTIALPTAAHLGATTFGALAAELRARGDVLLGASFAADRGGLHLNPGAAFPLSFRDGDRLVVLQKDLCGGGAG